MSKEKPPHPHYPPLKLVTENGIPVTPKVKESGTDSDLEKDFYKSLGIDTGDKFNFSNFPPPRPLDSFETDEHPDYFIPPHRSVVEELDHMEQAKQERRVARGKARKGWWGKFWKGVKRAFTGEKK